MDAVNWKNWTLLYSLICIKWAFICISSGDVFQIDIGEKTKERTSMKRCVFCSFCGTDFE